MNKTEAVALAQALTRQGFTPVAVHSVGPDGLTCSCPRGRRCTSPGKHPIGERWQDSNGVEEVGDLGGIYRRVNVGILPEHYREERGGVTYRLLVLDIDPRNGGSETARLLAQRSGGRMPDTRVVSTGSGGWHYYYLAPADRGYKGTAGRGVDVKTNGMVVVEGSRSGAGEYRLLKDHPLTLLPESLVSALERPVQAYEPPEPPQVDPGDPDVTRRQTYLQAAWAGILEEVKMLDDLRADSMADYDGPPWNATLFTQACNAFEVVNHPDSTLTEQDVRDGLSKAMPTDDNFTGEDIRKTLDSACRKVEGKAKEVPPPTTTKLFTPPEGDIDGETEEPLLVRMIAQQKDSGDYGWTDIDFARLVTKEYGDELAYVPNLGWFVWDGKQMVLGDEPAAQAIVLGMMVRLREEAVEMGLDKKGAKEIRDRLGASRSASVTAMLRAMAELRYKVDDMDADNHLLNTPNGVVDLRTGALMPHSPLLRMTKMTEAHYNPDARHPDVEKSLEALRPDARDWLQMRFGQALTGETPNDDRLLFLHGGGSNGKSALLGAFQKAVGTYGVVVSERVVTAVDSAHPTEMTDLLGARVALLEELPENGVLNAKRIKNMAGTHVMTARKVHRDSVTWVASHTVFVTTNHRPKVKETDHGTWRRLALVDFPYRYVRSQKDVTTENDRVGDPGLRARMRGADQQEALLAWAVRGAARLHEAGGKMPDLPVTVAADTREWRGDIDQVGIFAEDRLEPAPKNVGVASTDLYAAFREWQQQHGHTPWSDTLLAERMKSSEVMAGAEKGKFRVASPEDDGTMTRISVSYPPNQVARQTYEPGQRIHSWRGVRWREAASGDSGDML